MKFVIGRDNNTHIRITDISVSRNHSLLTFSEGNFYVKDTKSKFGTLILLQSPFKIPYNNKWDLTLQIGKYLSNLILFLFYLVVINPEISQRNVCGGASYK